MISLFKKLRRRWEIHKEEVFNKELYDHLKNSLDFSVHNINWKSYGEWDAFANFRVEKAHPNVQTIAKIIAEFVSIKMSPIYSYAATSSPFRHFTFYLDFPYVYMKADIYDSMGINVNRYFLFETTARKVEDILKDSPRLLFYFVEGHKSHVVRHCSGEKKWINRLFYHYHLPHDMDNNIECPHCRNLYYGENLKQYRDGVNPLPLNWSTEDTPKSIVLQNLRDKKLCLNNSEMQILRKLEADDNSNDQEFYNKLQHITGVEDLFVLDEPVKSKWEILDL